MRSDEPDHPHLDLCKCDKCLGVDKVKPDCDGVFCAIYNSICERCPEEVRMKCKAKREEINALVLKYGSEGILPFLHGATVASYAEEHLDMKEAD